jgi:uncharacterized membrane protein YccC
MARTQWWDWALGVGMLILALFVSCMMSLAENTRMGS